MENTLSHIMYLYNMWFYADRGVLVQPKEKKCQNKSFL